MGQYHAIRRKYNGEQNRHASLKSIPSAYLLTPLTLTSMKDRIPENETSIPFTVYGSSTSFLPLCGSEYMRH